MFHAMKGQDQKHTSNKTSNMSEPCYSAIITNYAVKYPYEYPNYNQNYCRYAYNSNQEFKKTNVFTRVKGNRIRYPPSITEIATLVPTIGISE